VTPRPRADDDQDARLRAERLRFARYRASGDPREREQLIERYLPLARRLARRYASALEPFDDLLQVACLGLLKAVDRFDPERGTAFTSYAVPTITGELRRYYRDYTWAVRMPRELQELSLRIEHAWTELAATGGHTPTVGELAARLDADDEAILAALEAATAHHADALVPDGEPADDDHRRKHRHAEADPGYELTEDRELLAGLLATLQPHERRILYLRFHLGLTQSEIGRRVGVSQMSVSRILRSSMERLGGAAEGESSAH
jgi:RNA polymerase sigma-B factor